MTADVVDILLARSAESLSRRKRRRKCRGSYNKVPRPSFSREQLVLFAREVKFKNRKQLFSSRQPTDPSPYDYVKEFGSFTEAMKNIWRDESVAVNRRYVVQSIVEFGLWSRREYQKLRMRRSDLLPSMHAIICEFGSWDAAKDIAMVLSLRETLAAYVALKARLKRRPSLEDCRRARIDISRATRLLGGKKYVDQLVSSMEKMI